MSTRLAVSILIYPMVQAVLFGMGVLLVLLSPMARDAMTMIPAVGVISGVAGTAIAWRIAPRMMLGHRRRRVLRLVWSRP